MGAGSVLGFLVGVMTGFFGAGGGFILTPVLNICLGVPMNFAVGTSAFQILGTSTVSLWKRLDRRLLGIKVAVWLGLGIPPGTFCGAKVVDCFKSMKAWHLLGVRVSPVDFTLLSVFCLLLLLLALMMFHDAYGKTPEETASRTGVLSKLRIPPMRCFRTIPAGQFSLPVLIVVGGAVGFLSGLLGIGGGVVLLPILFLLIGQEVKAATQTSLMLVFLSGLFSTFFHAVDGNIDYALAVALLAGGIPGAHFGSKLHAGCSEHAIRKGFAFVVSGAWLLVVFKLVRMLSAEI